MTQILKLENICRSYQQKNYKTVILDDANYSFNQGEMVGLLAPSGSGKSTLLQIAGLLELPNSGNVWIKEQKICGLSNKKRTIIRRDLIGFIYQLHHLLSEFTAVENVMIPLLIKGFSKIDAKKRAQELLERMLLKDRENNRPFELSGGEQQRVAIARALIHNPLILLADEPTGNLDPQTSQEIFDILLELVREKNMCALIATHDHDLAKKMNKRITLEKGKILNIK